MFAPTHSGHLRIGRLLIWTTVKHQRNWRIGFAAGPEEAARTDRWLKVHEAANRLQSSYDWVEAFAGRVTELSATGTVRKSKS